ncbi:MAG: hypothetical protein GY749_49345 [Desulfobacteraceae bacterium]|nr:hypothetical protein [Desulfobacteraceae bacterium]
MNTEEEKIQEEIRKRVLKKYEILEEEKKKSEHSQSYLEALHEMTGIPHKELSKISQEVRESHSLEKQSIFRSSKAAFLGTVILLLIISAVCLISFKGSLPSDPLKLLETAKTWPLVAKDSFDTNEMGWNTGSFENKGRKAMREIAHGKYLWKMEALKGGGVKRWHTPPLNPISDFCLSAEGKLVKGPVTARYGLVFYREGKSYYAFRIQDSRSFRVRRFENGEYTDPISYTRTSAVRPGEANRLTIVATDSTIYFYINDQHIGDMPNDKTNKGNVGLIIALSKLGDKAAVEFDNFELRKKP